MRKRDADNLRGMIDPAPRERPRQVEQKRNALERLLWIGYRLTQVPYRVLKLPYFMDWLRLELHRIEGDAKLSDQALREEFQSSLAKTAHSISERAEQIRHELIATTDAFLERALGQTHNARQELLIALEKAEKRHEEERELIEKKLDAFGSTLEQQGERILGLSGQIRTLDRALEERGEGQGDANPRAATSLQLPTYPAAERLLSAFYLRFQRRFRGSEIDLETRFTSYRNLLIDRGFDPVRSRLIDLACGDGIFLSIWNTQGCPATGVDSNPVMVEEARAKGRAVEEADALDYLAKQPDESADVITAFQFVEHLSPMALAEVIRQSARVLRPGGILLVETINPECVFSRKWFQLDLSHERLIHPEVLGMLAETAGFCRYEWTGIHPVSDGEKLSGQDRDTERLNAFLFGFQDYYLIAEK